MSNHSVPIPDLQEQLKRENAPILISTNAELVGAITLFTDLTPRNSMETLRQRLRLTLIMGGRPTDRSTNSYPHPLSPIDSARILLTDRAWTPLSFRSLRRVFDTDGTELLRVLSCLARHVVDAYKGEEEPVMGVELARRRVLQELETDPENFDASLAAWVFHDPADTTIEAFQVDILAKWKVSPIRLRPIAEAHGIPLDDLIATEGDIDAARELAALRGARGGSSDHAQTNRARNQDEDRRERNSEGSSNSTYAFQDARSIVPIVTSLYLVKGVVPQRGLVVIYGKSNVGKSFVAIELAVCTAYGLPWLGHKTRAARVVYVTAENPTGLRNRIWARLQAVPEPDRAAGMLQVVSTIVRLNDEDADVDRFVDDVTNQLADGVDLIVIDTLSQAMAGRNENGSEDMTAAVAACQRLCDRLGTTVVLVHHAGKDESRGARGHSSLRAAVDVELEVRSENERLPAAIRTIAMSKQRDGRWMPEKSFQLVDVIIGRDEDGEEVTTALLKPSDPPRRKAAEKFRPLLEVIAMMNRERLGRRITRADLAGSGYLDDLKSEFDTAVPVWGFDRDDVTERLQRRHLECRLERQKATIKRLPTKDEKDADRRKAKTEIDAAISSRLLYGAGENNSIIWPSVGETTES